MSSPAKIFISYSRQDRPWLERIKIHLAPLIRNGVLDAWDDSRIPPGANWESSICTALAEAQAAVLLISADYLASDFIASEELPALLEGERRRGLTIIPVVLRSCRIRPNSPLAKFQAVNALNHPAQELSQAEQEALWMRVADAVDTAIQKGHVPTPQRATRTFRLPYPRNPYFTGRKEVFLQVAEQLAATGLCGISGLGGMGKTQVALEFAYRQAAQYQHAFWIRSDTPQALSANAADIAEVLDLPDRLQDHAVTAVREWLENKENWLLVLDAADHLEVLQPLWPQSFRGHILVTSRSPIQHRIGITSPIELQPLSDPEALAFFQIRAGRELSETGEISAATELARELGNLPLALEQAVAYVAANRSRFDDYLKGYRRRRIQVLRPPIAGGYAESISTTWALNFREVEQLAQSADLLRFSAFLAPDHIPLELIEEAAPDLGDSIASALRDVLDDPLTLDETLEPLTRYSLVRRNLSNRTYSVHRVVQAVILDGMPIENQKIWAERATRAIQKCFPKGAELDGRKAVRLIRHAQTCANHIAKYNFSFAEAGYLLLDAATYLRKRAQYAESAHLLQQLLKIRESVLGSEHIAVAQVLEDLAKLYRAQGSYDTAESALLRGVQIIEKQCGPRDVESAPLLNSLAAVKRDKKEFQTAEIIAKEALEIQQEKLSPDDPRIAKTLTTLGSLLLERGDIDGAGALFSRAVTIEEIASGKHESNLAASLTALGEVRRRQGDLSSASQLIRRAISIDEDLRGPHHPGLAWSLCALARIYKDEGNSNDAVAVLQRSLEIRQTALGSNHPLTRQIANDL